MFKVVPDQLKISDGWVRCGHCSDVFDATLSLESMVAESLPASPDFPSSAGQQPIPPAVVRPPREEDVSRPPPLGGSEEQNRSNVPGNGSRDTGGGHANPPRPGINLRENGFIPGEPPERHPSSGLSANTTEPLFVRQARRNAFWRSPTTRAVLVLMVLVLGGLLVAQWGVHERDRLAARYPMTLPWLTSLCQPLGCHFEPVRQIESVVIDSSSFAKRLGNFYAFDMVLKNNADIPVAVPALELSLTDAREAVVSRRVFLPRDWPDSPAHLPAGGSVSVSLRLALSDQGLSSMSGYRALVFYP